MPRRHTTHPALSQSTELFTSRPNGRRRVQPPAREGRAWAGGGQQRGSPVDAPRKPQNLSWKPRNLSRWNRHHRRRKTSSSDGNPDRRHSRPCPSQQQPSLDWWIQPAHCSMIDIAEPAGQQSTWYQVISEPWTPSFAYTGAAHARCRPHTPPSSGNQH